MIYLWQRNGQEDAPLLRELGRLREIAFRAVGEGSGKRRDIDGYDDDYLHLILWDEEDLEIVGAYRFMPTAIQLAKRGLEGIYSYSLFHYDGRMDDVLQHGIELGRSFIQPRYWGRRGLDYLWSADNETRVQAAFSKLSEGKTVIMIAHRLSTVVGVDTIYVVEDGRIVQRGTSAELMAKDGVFRRMWQNYQTSVVWKVAKEV